MLKDSALALIMRVLGAVLWLTYTILIARLLPQVDFGLVMYAINVVLISTPIASFGFTQATIKFGSKHFSSGDVLGFKALIVQGRSFAILGGTLVLLTLLVGTALDWDTPATQSFDIAVMTGAATIASVLMAVHQCALRADDRLVQALVGFAILRPVIPALGALVLALTGVLSARAALALYVFATWSSVAYEIWRLRRLKTAERSQPRLEVSVEKTPVTAQALAMWPGEIGGILLARIGGLVVGAVLGLEAAALYIAAERVATLAQFLMDAIRTAAAPEIARLAATKTANTKDLQKAVSKASLLMAIAGALGLLGLAMIGWLLLRVMGEAYTQAYPVLLLILLAQASWAFFGPTAIALNMTGLHWQRSIGTMIAAGVAALAAFIGSKVSGPGGAALGYACAAWILNASFYYVLKAKRGLTIGLVSVTRADLKALHDTSKRFREKTWGRFGGANGGRF